MLGLPLYGDVATPTHSSCLVGIVSSGDITGVFICLSLCKCVSGSLGTALGSSQVACFR